MIFFSLFALVMLWHIVRLFVYKQHGQRPREWSLKKGKKDESVKEEFTKEGES